MDISHTGYFYFFLQFATQHFVAVAGFKTGVLHVKSFLQLVSQQKVARKIASCNMAFSGEITRTVVWCLLMGGVHLWKVSVSGGSAVFDH